MTDLQQKLATLFSFEIPESTSAFFDAEAPESVEADRLIRELAEVEALLVSAAASRLAKNPPSCVKNRLLEKLPALRQQRFPDFVCEALAEAHFPEPKGEECVVFACPKGLIQWVNPAFTAMCGYELHELRGRKPAAFVQCPETEPASIEALSNAVHRRRPIEIQMTNCHRSGQRYRVHIAMRPVSRGFVAVEREVTAGR